MLPHTKIDSLQAMYYRPPIHNIIASYLTILVITLMMISMGYEGGEFARDRVKTYPKEESRQDLMNGGSIENTDSTLQAYITPEAHSKVNSIGAESVEENKSRETNNTNAQKKPTLAHNQKKVDVQSTNNATSEAHPVDTAIDEYWNINIASLTEENKASDLVHHALSKGVDATKKQVTVHGKNYWRVSVKGLPSADKAKAYALLVKDRLGLRNVWISKESDQS